MYTSQTEHLNGFFRPESVAALQIIFNQITRPSITAAQIAKMQSDFLSIVAQEKGLTKAPCFVSPNGMNFIFCIFETGKMILLNPYGVTLLFQDWRIFDGELSIPSVQWMEEDNLVILDVYYIVRDLLHKCICHFSNDEHRFVHFTEPQKNSPISVIHNTTKQEQYFDETIWLCSQCASINLLSDRFCVKCGAPRSF